MITNGAARVVLIGKSRDKKKHKNKTSVLSNVNPTEIPKEFIDGIAITFEGDEEKVVQFDTANIKENFTIDGMSDWLSKIDRKGLVKLVEITLDLDRVYETLQQDSDSIFAKYF